MTDHDNTEELPEVTVVGLAVKLVITGTFVPLTVTVAVAVTEPTLLVAVSVYVIVADGVTVYVPEVALTVLIL